jgi:hypothetical protein
MSPHYGKFIAHFRAQIGKANPAWVLMHSAITHVAIPDCSTGGRKPIVRGRHVGEAVVD